MTMNFTYKELELINDNYRSISNQMNTALGLIAEGDEDDVIRVHQIACDAFIEFIERELGKSQAEFLSVISPFIRRLFRDDTPEAILNYHFYNCAFVKVLEAYASEESY